MALGTYELVRELGAGGMGTVWLGRDASGNTVAIKRLHPQLTDAATQKRFLREASIRIVHPNVVSVLDAGEDEHGAPWIAFELLEGETLEERLRRGPLSVEETVELGAQIARGLGAAHAAGVVHRDLKPSNVFVTSAGVAKVLDFGIALLSGNGTRYTRTGAIVGTPWYLAPEQARGEHDLDARVDVWTIGAVLYECLVGRGPFERDGALATVLAILREEPVPLPQIAPSVPDGLWQVIARCLSKPRELRFGTMGDLEEALGAHASSPSHAHAAQRFVVPPVAEGETRVVALLLCDEVTHSERIREEVEQRGGLHYGLYGGRAVGLWGARFSHADEALRAARSALLIAAGSMACAKRVVLVLGRIESRDGRLAGEALAHAESLIALEPSSVTRAVVIDDAMRQALRERFATEPFAPNAAWLHRELASEPPPLREASALTSAKVPAVSSIAPGRREGAPLVGRDLERASIRKAMTVCFAESHARGVLLIGPPGIGKSRLLRESYGPAREAGAHILVGRAESFRQHAELAIFADAMARVVAMQAREAGIGELEALEGLVGELAPDVRRDLSVSALAAWLGIASEPRHEVDARTIGHTQATVRDTELGALGRESAPQLRIADHARLWIWELCQLWAQRGPVVLMLEDLHWADDASLRLVGDLLVAFAELPWFVVGTARPEVAERQSMLGPAMSGIGVEALPQSAIRALASAILGRNVSDSWVAQLATHTGGNALFVEQVLYEVREGGAEILALEPGPDASLPLPSTVAAAVQARLDRLSPRAREVCRALSVVGRACPVDLLASVIGDVSTDELETLVRLQLIVRRALPRAASEYRVAHAVVSDAMYLSLTEGHRAELHRRVAQSLEERADSPLEEVAEHYARAGEIEKAVRYFERAVLRHKAHEDVRALRVCAERLEALGGARDQRAAVAVATAWGLTQQGGQASTIAALQAALQHALSAAQRVQVEMQLSSMRADWDALERACWKARELGDDELLGGGLAAIVWPALQKGERARAERAIEELNALALRTGSPRVGARAASAVAFGAAARGQSKRAFDAFRQASELAREAGMLALAATSDANAHDCLNRIGRYDQAATALVRAAKRLAVLGATRSQEHVLMNAAYALTRSGRAEEALAILGGLAVLSYSPSAVAVYRARALLTLGRHEDALAAAAGSPSADELPWTSALSDALSAGALLALGRPQEALVRARNAMQLRDHLGELAEDDAEVFLALAQALRANGQDAEACEVLERGRSWLLQAAEKMADAAWSAELLHNVPTHRQLLAAAEARSVSTT